MIRCFIIFFLFIGRNRCDYDTSNSLKTRPQQPYHVIPNLINFTMLLGTLSTHTEKGAIEQVRSSTNFNLTLCYDYVILNWLAITSIY